MSDDGHHGKRSKTTNIKAAIYCRLALFAYVAAWHFSDTICGGNILPPGPERVN
ncbi:hypothetical protein J6590_009345 [Homalodisca vitripennis]|nr:hypothetical protein J6590_009345 [Homalodisca vitripennis]